MTEPLFDAWESALPAVLALMSDQQRGMFRQELQRLLAASRFDPEAAAQVAPQVLELLLQAARAARQPPAIAALREPGADGALVGLCEHLLASWRDAEAAAADATGCDPGDAGVFFGPRLGGPGRRGAVRRPDHRED